MRAIFGILALASLLACLALPVMHFRGNLSNEAYKNLFLIASVAWFVFAIPWVAKGQHSRK